MLIELLVGILNLLVGIWEQLVLLVDGVLGYWVDLDAAEPLTSGGSAFVDQLAATAIVVADFLTRFAAAL